MTAAAEMPDDILHAAEECVIHLSEIKGETRWLLRGMISNAILADRQRDQWRDISTAPKTGRFLALAAGHTERQSWEDPATIITINAFDGPMICEGFESGKGYIDEFGEQYGPDGRVDDAEDLTAADDILRLTHWQPLPAAPKGGAE